VLRRALLATLLVSAITRVLCAKERILLHRIGPSQSTLLIANDGSEELLQIAALTTTPHSALTGAGSSLRPSAAVRPTSTVCTRMDQALND
jgi:hypothetical protein